LEFLSFYYHILEIAFLSRYTQTNNDFLVNLIIQRVSFTPPHLERKRVNRFIYFSSIITVQVSITRVIVAVKLDPALYISLISSLFPKCLEIALSTLLSFVLFYLSLSLLSSFFFCSTLIHDFDFSILKFCMLWSIDMDLRFFSDCRFQEFHTAFNGSSFIENYLYSFWIIGFIIE